ncbi:MAG: exodeoxyribonuclease VII large subunit, partial [Gammaproteobacteria bacterium]|nr:exodeoxyribonuclease VII large subunit [Gammaproteobacteria bacterium]
EGRGEFQMIAEEMEESGEGVLRRAFEKLKQKLAAEGLFEESRKQALPVMPAHIGIITSPTGAAIRDVLHVLQRRFPAIGVSILPVQVQGEESPAQIVRAIEMANRYQTDSLIAPDPFLGPFSGPFDVLLLTRGGGSLEDLWAFNTEQVARAIAASGLPVISAVGHETDFSIADFVADLRAPTPSAAAEMLSPDQTEWKQTFGRYALHLTRLMREKLQNAGQQQGHLSRRLRNPVHKLQGYQQQADGLEMRLQRSAKQQVARLQMQLNLQRTRLASPVHQLNRLNESLRQRQAGLISGLQSSLKGKQNALGMVVQKMNALSPLATLERGYAIVTKGEGLTQVIKSSEEVNPGDRIHARLRRGTIVAEVKSTLDDT